jgi:hypothetical protein
VAGQYQVNFNGHWAAAASGVCDIALFKNLASGGGFTTAEGSDAPCAGGPVNALSTVVRLGAGDSLALLPFQNSGGALNLSFTAANGSFSMVWLGP